MTSSQQSLLSEEHLEELFSLTNRDNVTLALYTKIITPEQLALLPKKYYGAVFGNNSAGAEALQKKLITLEEIAKMPSAEHVFALLNTDLDGLAILEEKLVTSEQIIAMPTVEHIIALSDPNIMDALERKLITPEEIAASDDLQQLNSDTIAKIEAVTQDMQP